MTLSDVAADARAHPLAFIVPALLVAAAVLALRWSCARPPPPVLVATSKVDAAAELARFVAAEQATDTKRHVVTTTTSGKDKRGRPFKRTVKVEDVAEHTAAKVEEHATAHLEEHAAATLTVTPPAPAEPRVRLDIAAEWSADRLQLKPTLRAEGEVRAAGPLWLYVSVAPPVLGQALDVRGGVKLVWER